MARAYFLLETFSPLPAFLLRRLARSRKAEPHHHRQSFRPMFYNSEPNAAVKRLRQRKRRFAAEENVCKDASVH